MSNKYPGGFINKTAPTLNPALGNAAPGIWNMTQVQQAVKAGTWPAYDPYYKNVTMMLHGDGTNGAQNNTFLDSSTNNFTITRNGNTTQGTFTPYGSNWSNYFDGSGDYLTAPNSTAFDLSTSDFTIEGFFYPTVGSAFQSVFAYASNAGASISDYAFQLLLNSSNGINFRVVASGSSSFTTISTSNTFTLNSWNYVCVTRTGTSVSIYLNGTTTTGTIASTIRNNASSILTIGRDPDGTYAITGYLSNLRILKGTAVTPSTPTAPLTAITNTSLLTCQSNRFIDNSTNNFTITKNGDVSVQRFSPFSPTTAYSTGVIGGSGYFDGTGDYLSVPSSSSFKPASSDFTIEAWVYVSNTGVLQTVYGDCDSGTNNGMCELSVSSTLKVEVDYFTSSTAVVTKLTTGSIQANAWNHICVSKTGTTMYIGYNGTLETFTGVPSTMQSPATLYPALGRLGAYAGYYITGYISNFRFVIGSAVYTGSTYTVPTAPLTAISGTSLLCSFINAGILDNAMMNDLETVGNAQISTSVKKYGTGSMYFDGTADYLKAANTLISNFGSGAFTVEAWVYFNSVSGTQVIAGNYQSSTVGWSFGKSGSTGYFFASFSGDGNDINGTTTVAINTWYHVAISGTPGATGLKLFVNGVQEGSTYTGAVSLDATTPLYISDLSGLGYGINGYIDDLRITKGVARYTANFTPPTSQLQDQ